MRMLYPSGSADLPRLSSDVFFADPESIAHYEGLFDRLASHIESFQLSSPTLWRRFVEQFRTDADSEDAGWRGEYWGKMMRGACFVYSYTKSDALYRILEETVSDMIDCADADGRISTYSRACEFDGWDIWSRKYVLLGMQYFYDICRDAALRARILEALCRQADYLVAHIGTEDKKIPITRATRHWRGLNSSSLLEPVVRLYNMTGKEDYLTFASYIVSEGGTDIANLFELAYENDFYPYQYPVTKAYEMISCFEGLLEYYRVTHEERYRRAVLNFADRILESDFTVIGSSGCTHELFDHSLVRQANTTNGSIMQETCVTVTLMKFFFQLTSLTGESKYADAFETSLYNAYLGALNTESVIETSLCEEHPDWKLEALPFDSYSPLTAGTRGNGIGGLKLMSDGHYYGCCACISPLGCGLVGKMHLLTAADGFAMNLYLPGTVKSLTPGGQSVRFLTETAYPCEGTVRITLSLERPEQMTLRFRNPAWSRATVATLGEDAIPVTDGYITLSRLWQDGDTVTLQLDMRTEVIRPIPYGTDILMNHVIWDQHYVVPQFDREDPLAHRHVALRRGPLMLAQDSRLGYSVDEPIEIDIDGVPDHAVISSKPVAPYPNLLEMEIPLKDGGTMHLTDYASAGKLWSNESRMAVWMSVK